MKWQLLCCGVIQGLIRFVLWDSTYVFSHNRNHDLNSRWPDLRLFTNINGCRAGWGYACLFTVCERSEWPSSKFLLFYARIVMVLQTMNAQLCLVVGPTHECGGMFDLMTVVPSTSMGCCCSTHKSLGSLISLGGHFDGAGCSKLVC